MLTQSLLEIIKLCTNTRISELHYQVIDINIRLKCNILLNKLWLKPLKVHMNANLFKSQVGLYFIICENLNIKIITNRIVLNCIVCKV